MVIRIRINDTLYINKLISYCNHFLTTFCVGYACIVAWRVCLYCLLADVRNATKDTQIVGVK